MIRALKNFCFFEIVFSIIFIGLILNSLPVLPLTGYVGVSFADIELIDPSEFIFPDDFQETQKASQDAQSIEDFITTIVDGRSDVIREMYIKGFVALEIVQQPSGQAAFVSSADNVITEFSMAKNYGVIGLLAHNYLAGRYFSDLKIGDIISIVYGNGEIDEYQINDIQSYQALQPNSPNSQFKDLLTNEQLSAPQLFRRVYAGNHHLTLQTCIQEGEIDTWGRLFIIAEPV